MSGTTTVLILNVERMWFEATHEQKQRFQKVVFPQGLAYQNGLIGATPSALIFGPYGPKMGPE